MNHPADGATLPAELTQPQATGGPLGTSLFGIPNLPAIADWMPGQRLGPYRLKSRLGKGGMGVVWLAEQLEPFQREVAIKLLPRELQSPLTEVYFEVERQALATLSHRAIAQIHDAGRLPDGALYFAMEYVPGQPLNRFVRDHALGIKSLMGLFIEICRGVQHAHQRGLIHRDLKPLNILVHREDGRPVPKIIDFGIAIGARPGQVVQDNSGEIIGTPAYMAPEQKHPGPAGIDARVDVYALGAIMVELLCRSAGLEADTGAVDSAVRREGLALSMGQPPSVEEQAAEAAALVERLKATPVELRSIAIKALAPDREERYDSAAALADDLEQWFRQLPVQAMGTGRWYLTCCFVRRNRLATAAAVAVLLALVTGVLFALHGMNQARAAQALAEQRRNDAEALIQYMLGDFADKLRPLGRLDLLDNVGAKALDYLAAQDASRDAGSLLSRARALRTVGEVRTTRQQYAEAEAALKAADELLAGALAAAKPDPDPELVFEAAQIAFYRGTNAYRQDDTAGTAPYWQRYLDLAQRLNQLEGESVRARTELAYALTNLGVLAERQDHFSGAISRIEAALAIRRSLIQGPADALNEDLSRALSWLARVRSVIGDVRGSWEAAVEAVAVIEAQRKAGNDSASAQSTEANHRFILGNYERQFDRPERAIAEWTRARALAESLVANDPTQPRPQYQLARISYALALIPEASPAEASRSHEIAAAALRMLESQNLTAVERLELELLDAASTLRLQTVTPASLNRAEVLLQRLLTSDSSRSTAHSLLGAAAAVCDGLNAARPERSAEWRQRLLEVLEQTPVSRQRSMAHLFLRRRLSPPDQHVELDARIAELRATIPKIDKP
ncbi:MAG: serine/threonine protein kinase [Xanthomonadales bacterium]|jgi:tetratricopeptide (TPR) repeat protein|nr:serine/threonine protein kinase [Xanthomonadales bacterium]